MSTSGARRRSQVLSSLDDQRPRLLQVLHEQRIGPGLVLIIAQPEHVRGMHRQDALGAVSETFRRAAILHHRHGMAEHRPTRRGAQGVLTVHPSYMLRLREDED